MSSVTQYKKGEGLASYEVGQRVALSNGRLAMVVTGPTGKKMLRFVSANGAPAAAAAAAVAVVRAPAAPKERKRSTPSSKAGFTGYCGGLSETSCRSDDKCTWKTTKCVAGWGADKVGQQSKAIRVASKLQSSFRKRKQRKSMDALFGPSSPPVELDTSGFEVEY